MKKIWHFLLGVVTGMVLIIGLGLVVNKSTGGSNLIGATFFDEPGEALSGSYFEVFQALSDGFGLAREKGNYSGPVVLIYDQQMKPFYDDQVVKVPSGKHFVQVGIYKYSSNSGGKTVPIITLMDK